jgi:hypothetical protein
MKQPLKGIAIMTYLFAYILFGFGFYIGLALSRTDSFKNQSISSVLKGFILGFLFWPLAIVLWPLWRKQ